jgi:hypothetical protein
VWVEVAELQGVELDGAVLDLAQAADVLEPVAERAAQVPAELGDGHGVDHRGTAGRVGDAKARERAGGRGAVREVAAQRVGRVAQAEDAPGQQVLLAGEEEAARGQWLAVGGLTSGDEGDALAAVADRLEQVEVAGVAAAVAEDAEVLAQRVGQEGVGADGLGDRSVVKTGEDQDRRRVVVEVEPAEHLDLAGARVLGDAQAGDLREHEAQRGRAVDVRLELGGGAGQAAERAGDLEAGRGDPGVARVRRVDVDVAVGVAQDLEHGLEPLGQRAARTLERGEQPRDDLEQHLHPLDGLLVAEPRAAAGVVQVVGVVAVEHGQPLDDDRHVLLDRVAGGWDGSVAVAGDGSGLSVGTGCGSRWARASCGRRAGGGPRPRRRGGA